MAGITIGRVDHASHTPSEDVRRERSASLRRLSGPLVLAAIAFAAYAGTLGHGLVWDDPSLLKTIRDVVREEGVPGLLTAEFRLYPDQPLGYFRPLVNLSLHLDSRISGVFPPAFHVTNVALHTAVTVLLHGLLRALGGPGAGAFLGGLLFAVHPIHTESVAFVSGRTDLLSAFFVLLAALCWARERYGERRHPVALHVAGILSYAMGTLCKEAAFLLPAALIAWDALGLRGAGDRPDSWWKRNAAWLTGFGGALLCVLLFRLGVARVGFGGAGDAALESGGASPSAAPVLFLQYLRLLVVPWPLRAYYTDRELALSPVTVGAALLLLGFCAAASGKEFRRAGLLALAWVAIFLSPVSGVVPLHGAPLAERFLYLPSAGLSVLAAFSAARTGEAGRLRLPLLGATAAVLALCLAGTVSRSAVWEDNMTLFSDMVRTTPGFSQAYYNLGNVYKTRGRHAEAIEAYEHALRINPRHSEAYNNLGNTYLLLGSAGKAVEAYRQALRVRPRYFESWNNLGIAYRTLRLYPQSVDSIGEALRIRPGDPDARINLGNTFLEQGRHGEAVEQYRFVLGRDPGNADARYNLGFVLLRQGRKAEAMEQCRELLVVAPGMAKRLLAVIEGRVPK
jgi:tetratricopeptide (TPR) repeat protein